jgi:hypothetical protein
MNRITALLMLFLTINIFASSELPNNPVWKYRLIQYREVFQSKRNVIDSFLVNKSYDSLITHFYQDSVLRQCITVEEQFLLGAILNGAAFVNNSLNLDTLFMNSNINPKLRNRFDVSPFQKLIYSRAIRDQLILTLYSQFHNSIDSLFRDNKIDTAEYYFFRIVFPPVQLSFDSDMNNCEKYIRQFKKSRKSNLIYDYYYKRGKWDKFGFLFGTGMSLHWFGGEAASYFAPNLAWNMIYFDIFLQSVSLKAGIDFTGHNNNKVLVYKKDIIPEDASLNFSEIYFAGGYCFSYKERVMITPYFGFAKVFNNLSAAESNKLGFDPTFPNLNALKWGFTTYLNVQKNEKLQNVFETQYPLVTFDFSVENYDLKHLGIQNNATKYFAMVGFSGLLGKKTKLKIK